MLPSLLEQSSDSGMTRIDQNTFDLQIESPTGMRQGGQDKLVHDWVMLIHFVGVNGDLFLIATGSEGWSSVKAG